MQILQRRLSKESFCRSALDEYALYINHLQVFMNLRMAKVTYVGKEPQIITAITISSYIAKASMPLVISIVQKFSMMSALI